ncbi:unnamed protein product [Caenorhabditis angaria]|uniref:G-protein coupled receptors family 1 profile domain-containing protein n=1 Tax=Caenorhabditis angaria TaxID=860376 RepID=A0A9P1ITL9_9PELO|nr:unnamed protein product [Caenorhabditis angaria]
MASLKHYDWTETISIHTFAITLFINLFLIYLTMFRIKTIAGTYKILISFFAFLGILFSASNIIIQPFFHVHNHSLIFFTLRDFGGINIMALKICIMIYSMMFSLSGSFLTLLFYFRFTIIHSISQNLKYKKRCLVWWILFNVVCVFVYALALFIFASDDEDSLSYLKETMLFNYNCSLNDIAAFMNNYYLSEPGSPFSYKCIICTLLLSSTIVIPFLFSSYYAIRINHLLKKTLGMSVAHKNIQKQLFNSLNLQILSPAITMYLPMFIIITLPYLNLEIDIPFGDFNPLFILYPAIDSFIQITKTKKRGNTKMSSIVVGTGVVAETMVGLLAAAGRRVSMVAPSAKINNTKKFESQVIRNILQEDSEKKIPFEFVDDLKSQINLAEKNFKKINILTDLSKVEAADQIIDACQADESALLTHTAKNIPDATIISLNEKSPIHKNHVSVKIYSPIHDTKTVKMFINSKTSQKAIDETNNLLGSMGFTVLSEEDSLVADRLVQDMAQVEKSSPLSKLASILVTPMNSPIPPPPTQIKEQYQIYCKTNKSLLKNRLELILLYCRIVLDIFLGIGLTLYLTVILLKTLDPSKITVSTTYYVIFSSLPMVFLWPARFTLSICLGFLRIFALLSDLTYTSVKIVSCVVLFLSCVFGVSDVLFLLLICPPKFIAHPDCSALGCMASPCFLTYWIMNRSVFFSSMLICTLLYSFVICFCEANKQERRILKTDYWLVFTMFIATLFDVVPFAVTKFQFLENLFSHFGPFVNTLNILGNCIESVIISKMFEPFKHENSVY